VLVLAGDHIYKMDYGPMIGFHVEKEADITVGVVEVPVSRAREFGVCGVDEGNRVLNFLEKPRDRRRCRAARRRARVDGYLCVQPAVARASAASRRRGSCLGARLRQEHHPGGDRQAARVRLPVRDVRTKAQNYWRDVGTVDAYYEANLELVQVSPELNIYDEQWPIWTYQEQLPPAKFVFDDPDGRGAAIDSMVSGGCIISGSRVAKSLLF